MIKLTKNRNEEFESLLFLASYYRQNPAHFAKKKLA